MSAGAREGLAGPARAAPRRYAAPSTGRFVLLVVALAAAGLFAGGLTHLAVLGDHWFTEVARCRFGTAQALSPEAWRESQRCMAPAETVRAVYGVSGAALTLLGGVVVVAIVPWIVERRRSLRPLPATLEATAERVRSLASDAGVRRPPTVLLGRGSQRDAFSYGIPWRYRIVLPPKLAVRPWDRATFDPVVRHELAHIAHRDVALAWLARGVGYAVVPVLAVPLVAAVVEGDLSLAPSVLWRAAVVVLVVRLVGIAVLRSREHDADLAAAGDDAVRQSLRRLLEPSAVRGSMRDTARGLRGLLARHPTAASRAAVVDDPSLVVRPTLVDGLAAGFLAATAEPVVRAVTTTAMSGPGWTVQASALAASATGALLGVTVGVGLWRSAVYTRVSGRAFDPAATVVGVGLGAVLGQAVSLAGAAAPGLTAGARIGPWLLGGALAAGATVAVAGAGELWADVAPRTASARVHSVVAWVTSSALFTCAAWAGLEAGTVMGEWGWSGVLLVLAFHSPVPWVLLAGALLVAAVVVAVTVRRPGLPAPSWSVETVPVGAWPTATSPTLWGMLVVGVASGTAGAGGIVVYRLVVGPGSPSQTEARFFAYLLMAAAAGGVAMLALSAVWGAVGAAAGFVAASAAVVTTTVGFVVLNVALGGDPWALFLVMAGAAMTLVFLYAPVLAVVGARARSGRRADGDRRVSTAPGARRPRAVAAVAVAVVGSSVIAAVLLPAAATTVGRLEAMQRVAAGGDEDVSVGVYRQGVAPSMADGFVAAADAVDDINADPSEDPVHRAARLRQEVLPLLASMAAAAAAYQPPTEDLANVHHLAVEAIRELQVGYAGIADAMERQDAPAAATAEEHLREGVALRGSWLRAVTDLGEAPVED